MKINFILKLFNKVIVLTTILLLQAKIFFAKEYSNAKMDNVFVK